MSLYRYSGLIDLILSSIKESNESYQSLNEQQQSSPHRFGEEQRIDKSLPGQKLLFDSAFNEGIQL